MGENFPLRILKPHYDAILFSYGAPKDKELGIPGEKAIRNVYSAREFVGWYNGLPEHRDLAPDLTAGEDAVIIGQGNVALDVARILLSDINELRKTDIAEYAVEELLKSKIKRVRVVGRRGPMQVSACTTIDRSPAHTKLPDYRHPSQSRNCANSSNSHPSPSTRSRKTSSPQTTSSQPSHAPKNASSNSSKKAQPTTLQRPLNPGPWTSSSPPNA